MKKTGFEIALAALLPLCVYADNTGEDSSTKKEPFIEYHNRMVVFDPMHQAYERLQPNAFYIGVEGWYTLAYSSASGGHFPHKHTVDAIGEAEVRLGYNFFYNGRDHFTPFIGGGIFKDFSEYHIETWTWHAGVFHVHQGRTYRLPVLGYGTIGFLYDHEFNSVFNLGTNLKAIVGKGISFEHMRWGSVVVGFDIALPITFRFGHKRHWDIRIEPFDIYLHGSSNSRNYVGGRGTVGYRF